MVVHATLLERATLDRILGEEGGGTANVVIGILTAILLQKFMTIRRIINIIDINMHLQVLMQMVTLLNRIVLSLILEGEGEEEEEEINCMMICQHSAVCTQGGDPLAFK